MNEGAGSTGSTGGAAAALAARIERSGSVGFEELVEVALYGPDGFYERTGRAGRRAGHFLTSPEVGPLFGLVLAGALDRWWAELGEPDPFVVVDVGAGPGTLAKSVQLAAPRCAVALTYVLVERSATQRALHAERLALTEPAVALPPRADEDEPSARRPDGTGPRFVSLAELPALSVTGVILANELLDNLPFGLAELVDGRWHEVRVTTEAGRLVELAVPASPELETEVGALLADAAFAGAPMGHGARGEEVLGDGARGGEALGDGARLPVQRQARRWVRDALGLLEAGRLVVIDYTATTAELARRDPGEWVRTYRAHERGGAPLEDLGDQDITVEVCVDQLRTPRPPDRVTAQANWLAAWGIEDLVAEGRAIWHERAHVGDLAAMAARSRVREAEALCDPAGLGAFSVLEWIV